jgi:hypothetical protein
LRRAETLEKLLVRTVERLRGLPFRESGSPNQNALQGFEVFYSTPRAASFAITIRLGRPQRQLLLPFDDLTGPNDVVMEFLQCVRHFNAEETDALHERIENEAYFNNFTGLAKKLSPDGEKVRTVGFTSARGEETTEVALTRPAGPVWRGQTDERRTVELIGMIRSADETSKRGSHPVFGIEDDEGKTQNVTVRPGHLQDIVKPLWGERVRVVAVRQRGSRLQMVDLEPVKADENVAKAIE